jgi:hypothetical protein
MQEHPPNPPICGVNATMNLPTTHSVDNYQQLEGDIFSTLDLTLTFASTFKYIANGLALRTSLKM